MRVLVTRPEPGASRTAALLQARGHQPIVLPLTRTVPLAENDAANRSAGAYAVTSAAALRHWPAAGSGFQDGTVPLYAVGEATGKAAQDAGFADVRIGPGDGDGLAGMILSDVEAGRLQLSESAPLIYVAGRVRRSGFEAAIDAAKLPFRVVEAYDTEEISYSTDFLRKRILGDQPLAVLLYSQHGAAILFDRLSRIDALNTMKNSLFLCLSPQVAASVPASLRTQTHVAAAPNEADLLILLDALAATS